MKIKKYKCDCGTVLQEKVSILEEHKCPRCGKELHELNEDVGLIQKKLTCPKCNSYFPFEKSINECYICESYLTIYTPPPKIEKDL